MLYTTLLSPLFFYNLLKYKRKTYLLPFAGFLLVYDVIHLWQGVTLSGFLLSNAMFIFTYFSVMAFYHFVNRYERLGKLYSQIVLFNAAMVLIAIPFFFMPLPYKEYFWYINSLTAGLEKFPRLALFTYEASYYSLLLIPVLYYYVLKFLFNTIEHNRWLTLMLVLIPMLFSLSFGVIGVTLLVIFIMLVAFAKRLFRYKRPFLFICGSLLLLCIGWTVLWLWFPNNALFVRLHNVLAGTDTSTNGRIAESFTMAWRIISLKNVWFGVGLGQIKYMAVEVVHVYYTYWGKLPRYDIPNTMGETLAIFGVVGVVLRLSLEIWLFFKTRVYSNYYRLSLFLFVFAYQFTGSFITNIAEYVIWIMAFSQAFKQFDISAKKEVTHV